MEDIVTAVASNTATFIGDIFPLLPWALGISLAFMILAVFGRVFRFSLRQIFK